MIYRSLKEELQEHFNEVVLTDSGNLYRLVGIHIANDDYYYIYKIPYSATRNANSGNPFVHVSCVIGQVFLKDRFSEEEYSRMDRFLEMNGAEKEDTAIFKNTSTLQEHQGEITC